VATRVKIPSNKVGEAELLCMKHISPRLFYLHNKRGGAGWIAKKDGMDWFLEIENEKLATFILLKYS
jgi:hypothetical protein